MRRIVWISVSASGSSLYALCDDGSVWLLSYPADEANDPTAKWRRIDIKDITESP